jgi:polysaccharide pyruvyl transferase WcaK-like protein
MLRVIIPEAIPSKNKGELAILGGIREALNYYGPYELAVYSPLSLITDDTRNSNGHYRVVGGINLFGKDDSTSDIPIPRTRMHFFRTWGVLLAFSLLHRVSKRMAKRWFKDPLLDAIANADLILAGHDGMLTPYDFYLALAARIMKKPLALYGGSHGLRGRQKLRIRKYFQYMINRAILCTVRDPRAKEFFVANGIAPDKVQVFPDPAVLLKSCEDARARDILKAENIPQPEDAPLYGLIPVQVARGGRFMRESFISEDNPENKYRRYIQLWIEIVQHLLSVTNAHLIFIPHCLGPSENDDDRRMSRTIYDALSGDKSRLTLVENEYSASELKGIMKLCDYVSGERAHGLIGAFSAGTPCMALTTEGDLRMHYIMETMFERIVFDLTDPNMGELKNILAEEWNQRERTAQEMQRKVAEIRSEAIRAAELLSHRIHKHILERLS